MARNPIKQNTYAGGIRGQASINQQGTTTGTVKANNARVCGRWLPGVGACTRGKRRWRGRSEAETDGSREQRRLGRGGNGVCGGNGGTRGPWSGAPNAMAVNYQLKGQWKTGPPRLKLHPPMNIALGVAGLNFFFLWDPRLASTQLIIGKLHRGPYFF